MLDFDGGCIPDFGWRCLVTSECVRFRGGLVLKAHRLLYHSTLGLRVIKKKKISVRDAR